jgi:signal transduction histidine kinase
VLVPVSRSRVVPFAVIGAGVAAAVTSLLTTWPVAPYPPWVWLPVQLAGVSFTVCGAVLWLRRPTNGSGRLMAATGLVWYLGALQLSTNPVLYAVGFCLYHLGTVVMAHVVLALPSGRLEGRLRRWVVGSVYAGLLTQVARYIVEYPPQPQGWGDPAAEYSIWAPIGSVHQVVTTLVIMILVIRWWARSGRPARREFTLVWVIIVSLAGVTLATDAAAIANASLLVQQWLVLAYAMLLIAMPVAIAVGVLRVSLVRGRVGNLLLRLDGRLDRDRLGEALRHALDDPSLEVRYPVGAEPDAVRVDGGAAASVPDGRAATTVERDGTVFAVLLHDPALAGQPELVDSVVAAARFALERAQLEATRDAQLSELSESRARLANAADAERHRIQRDLHDGVQHKLLAAAMLVDSARAASPQLARASSALREAISELRALSAGIYPPALADQGLAVTVECLAEEAPLPVHFQVHGGRWPEAVERAAYFVITESLANVYKHARATACRVTVRPGRGDLVVEVADDGVGGADRCGTGLRGLADRVATVGGTLRIHSPAGSGTVVTAELPCAS